MCKTEFQFGLGLCPCINLEWAHKFSGKGWWLVGTAPQPKSQTRLFGRAGSHFPGDDPTEGPFFWVVLLLFVVFFNCVFCFCFLPQFLRFLSKSIQFCLEAIRIGDLPFRLVTCPLGRREPQHWAFFFGFTGSPRTSLFKFNVSFVFCAGFATLSRLIFCFHVCCIWHFPFSLVAFHRSIFFTYDVASFPLALVPSMYSSFVKCAPFQVAFALSIFPPFAILHLLNLHFVSPCFLQLSCVCPFQICIFQFLFLHCFSIFSRCKHPRTSAIRQHNATVHQRTKENVEDAHHMHRSAYFHGCCN